MRLRRKNYFRFNQGSDVQGGVGDGICRGLSKMCVGASREQEVVAMSATDFFDILANGLEGLSRDGLIARFSQFYWGDRNIVDENIINRIHTDEYNRVGCYIKISTCPWIPLLGYASYLKKRTWDMNHCGFLRRIDNNMIIFEPNIGCAIYDIIDNSELTLDNLNLAFRDMQWQRSIASYYFTYPCALAVIDAP